MIKKGVAKSNVSELDDKKDVRSLLIMVPRSYGLKWDLVKNILKMDNSALSDCVQSFIDAQFEKCKNEVSFIMLDNK